MYMGFVKIHRQIAFSCIYKDSFLVHLALHLILKANHTPRKILAGGELITLRRGQFITGRNMLSKETGIKPTTIYGKLKQLQKIGFCDIKSNKNGTLITLCNYETYQCSETTSRQPFRQIADRSMTDTRQIDDTNKNVKNEKNEKNGESITRSPEMIDFDYSHQTNGYPSAVNWPMNSDEQKLLLAWAEHIGRTPATLSARHREIILHGLRKYHGIYSTNELLELIPQLPKKPGFEAAIIEHEQHGRASPQRLLQTPEEKQKVINAMKAARLI